MGGIGEKTALWERHCIFKGTEEKTLYIDDAANVFAESELLKDNYLVLTDENSNCLLDILQATVLIHPNNLKEAFTGVIISYQNVRMLVTSMHCLDIKNPDYVGDKHGVYNVSELDENQQVRIIFEIGKQTFRQNPNPLNSLSILSANPSLDYVIFSYKGDAEGIEVEDSLNWPCKCVALGFPSKYHSIWSKTQKPLMSVGVCSPINYGHGFVPDFENTHPFGQLLYTGRTDGGSSGGPVISERGKLLGIATGTPILQDEHPVYTLISLINDSIRK